MTGPEGSKTPNDGTSADGTRAQPSRGGDNWLVGMMAEGRLVVARRRGRLDEFLPDVEAISERRHSPFATLLVLVLFGMVVAAVSWMAVSQVDQVASAPAVVRPTGKAKIVNHADGGTVAEIRVAEGQDVLRGAVLLRLDDRFVGQEIAKLTGLHLRQLAEVARLEAEAGNRALVFPAELDDQPHLRDEQTELYRARRDARAARREIAQQRIVQARQRVAALQAEIAGLQGAVDTLGGRLSDLRQLCDTKVLARDRCDGLAVQLSKETGALNARKQELVGAQAALAEAMQQLLAIEEEPIADVRERLARGRSEHIRLKAALEQQQQVRRNLEIRAPENGTVKDLKVAAVGQAVRPGEAILGIVPADEIGLELEARVSNLDRGFIRHDQIATLKFAVYDWIRFGVLQGRVVQIDRDTTNPATDDSGQTRATQQPYFRVVIRFEPPSGQAPVAPRLPCAADSCPITAGMAATAELHIGKRTILEFFTDRIFSTVLGSFREK